jgi:Eco57I restriction-modification methylase
VDVDALREIAGPAGPGGAPGAGDGPMGDAPDRRARGQYGTPPALAAWVAREVLAPLAGAGPVRVLDPAAGDGRFLAAARDALVAAGRPRAEAARGLIGLERDPELAAAARARLPGATIVVCEALCDAPALAAGVDAVVGNPPYVRSIRLRQADPALWAAVRGRFAATSHGEWDLYAAFVERALDWVRPGGRIGLVTPSRWWSAAFAAGLRGRLTAAGAVRAVVDFGAAQVFPGATTYAAVTVLERPAGAGAPAEVAVARLGAAGWEAGRVAAASLGAGPWRFAVGAAARALEAAAARGPALGDVARIVKGAGTNADGVFVLDRAELRGGAVRGITAAGPVEVEAAATRPCLRGRDVGAWTAPDPAGPHPRCLVPYDGARLIAWPELVRRWPRAAAHLTARRDQLEAREAGRFSGERFHAFGRPQNLAFHADPAAKVVVPDVARAGRAVVDTTGALVLDSAYALRPRPGAPSAYDADVLALVLGSPIVALWLAHAGVPLRGGYVRMKTAYLAPLPLPPPGDALAAAAGLARTDRRAALDALRAAYGLDPALWRAAPAPSVPARAARRA